MRVIPFREPVRLLFHLNGYTRVLLERFENQGMADGGVYMDIPTDAIPLTLRGIGCRFIINGEYIEVEADDDIGMIRKAVSEITVEETEGEEGAGRKGGNR